jgi:hypothetical protein
MAAVHASKHPHHVWYQNLLLTAHSLSVCCTAYPSIRLLRLAACATIGVVDSVADDVIVAMHPPVCHHKYCRRFRLFIDRAAALELVMLCTSSSPTTSNDNSRLSMMIKDMERTVLLL